MVPAAGDLGDGTADEILIERTLSGDESAFALLIQRYERPVYRKVHRILGWSSEDDDAVQEIFMRAYFGLRGFDPSYSFRPWIMRITANYCIDQLRKMRLRRVHVLSQMGEAERRRVNNTAASDARLDLASVQRHHCCEKLLGVIMEEMKPRYRIALVLRDLEGRKYADVAQALQVSQINARALVSRARKMIQEELRGRLPQTVESALHD